MAVSKTEPSLCCIDPDPSTNEVIGWVSMIVDTRGSGDWGLVADDGVRDAEVVDMDSSDKVEAAVDVD